ncbi:MAG: hypothetical protein BWY84_00652 [Candidatus Aerophobetes bacterium ADurb.Bin490]|nr:MAG: hypothetical protein BWY84_00652 [Candidatus Aerophobetes bacterium ADurb.Bin490]
MPAAMPAAAERPLSFSFMADKAHLKNTNTNIKKNPAAKSPYSAAN